MAWGYTTADGPVTRTTLTARFRRMQHGLQHTRSMLAGNDLLAAEIEQAIEAAAGAVNEIRHWVDAHLEDLGTAQDRHEPKPPGTREVPDDRRETRRPHDATVRRGRRPQAR